MSDARNRAVTEGRAALERATWPPFYGQDQHDTLAAREIAETVVDALAAVGLLRDDETPLADLADAVTEAYTVEGRARWWDSWARHPDKRAAMKAGVFAEWSGQPGEDSPACMLRSPGFDTEPEGFEPVDMAPFREDDDD